MFLRFLGAWMVLQTHKCFFGVDGRAGYCEITTVKVKQTRYPNLKLITIVNLLDFFGAVEIVYLNNTLNSYLLPIAWLAVFLL